MKLDREYWYKKFPLSEKCFYCGLRIDRSNSQRVMRIKDGPNDSDVYVLEDICLKCLPGVRANVLSKKGGASIIDHNTKTIVTSSTRHLAQMTDKEVKA